MCCVQHKTWLLLGVVLLVGGGLAAYLALNRQGERPPGREGAHALPDGPETPLPAPIAKGGMALVEALTLRRSLRDYTSRPVSREHIAQLCWAAQGITDRARGYRTAPSGGALFPITVFVVDQTGVFEYDPKRHALLQVFAGDVRGELQAAALDQPCVGAAPLCLVVTMDVGRSAAKYGGRAERLCLLEAGHVAQNVLLQATALGLGSVPVGAFDDAALAETLRLPERLRVGYLLPVGHPPG